MVVLTQATKNSSSWLCISNPSALIAVYIFLIGTCVWVSQNLCVLLAYLKLFERTLAYLELDQQPSILIGFGCGGANVNMGDNGVK